MNKAFVKDHEPINDRCPLCGSIGRTVPHEALVAHVMGDIAGHVSEPALFCPLPSCDVVYFDQFGRRVSPEMIKRPIYPKDDEAPICACFGLTREQIEQDCDEGVVTRCRGLVAKSKSSEARCSELAPDGRSCVPEMQRYYLRCTEDRRSSERRKPL
jgi:hypothetical protein